MTVIRCLTILTILFTIDVVTPRTPRASAADSLVHHWLLDESSGTTAADAVGSQDGTLENGPVWQPTGGYIDGALEFDGSDDRVNLGAFDVPTGTGLTITFWFQADDFDVSDARFISKATSQAEQDHYWMVSTISSTALRFRLKTGGSTTTLVTSTGEITTGEWTHVAATYDGLNMKIHKNGTAIATTAKAGVMDTNGAVAAAIGNQPPGAGANAFDGLIDDVRIYNRALSDAEIEAMVPTVPELFVQSVRPLPQRINADYDTDITVAFVNAVNTGTVGPASFRVFGRWSGPATGTYTFENGNKQVRFDPDNNFFAGEWVTVALSSDIEGQGGQVLKTGYAWNFWVKTAPGTLDLTPTDTLDIKENGEPKVTAYGAYAGDLDNDGWTDLSVPCEDGNDVRVFMNDGAGNYGGFTKYAVPGGNKPSANEGADFDMDGEIDICVGNVTGSEVSVMFGNGTGDYVSGASYSTAFGVRGVAVLDLNADGYDDIATANRNGDNVAVLLNNGAGAFGAASLIEGGGTSETGCAAADANGDGIMDLFVGCYTSQTVTLLLGNGNGVLTFSASADAGGQSWMIAVGDVNDDGHVDCVSANSFDDNIGVVLGDGEGGLADAVVIPAGNFILAIDLGDLDGDADLDMVTSNFGGEDWYIHENVNGTFLNPRILHATDAGSCAILHDRDNDLDLDMTGVDESDDLLFIFENDPPPTAAGDSPAAQRTRLVQNRPNPFNPSTTIPFELDADGHVTIMVFDVMGRRVNTLTNRSWPAGTHTVTWDGRDDAGARVGSGVYFYRLATADAVATRKMVLLK